MRWFRETHMEVTVMKDMVDHLKESHHQDTNVILNSNITKPIKIIHQITQLNTVRDREIKDKLMLCIQKLNTDSVTYLVPLSTTASTRDKTCVNRNRL